MRMGCESRGRRAAAHFGSSRYKESHIVLEALQRQSASRTMRSDIAGSPEVLRYTTPATSVRPAADETRSLDIVRRLQGAWAVQTVGARR